MLSESDLAPIVAAFDDVSPAVRHAALRVAALLLPAAGGRRLATRLHQIAEGSDEESRELAISAIRGAETTAPSRVPPSEHADSKSEDLSEPWSRPDRLRATFNEATSLQGRLFPAVGLLAYGESDWIERVFQEIESGPLNIAALALISGEHRHLSPPVVERLERIARDDHRREDVRRMAWLLVSTNATVPEPPIARLREHADQVATASLLEEQSGFPQTQYELFEAIRYVSPELGALLVVVLFQRCFQEALEPQGYAAGNFIVQVVAAIGSCFVPDIPALIELYLDGFQYARKPRAEWYRTRDEYVVFSTGSGHLALGWQIAWTISRAGIIEALAGATEFIESGNEQQREGALAMLEDVIRYLPFAYGPQFGGVTEPTTDVTLIAKTVNASAEAAPAASPRYTTVHVFFGTNRKPLDEEMQRRRRWFGSEQGGLTLGVCNVTVPLPPRHVIGELESRSWYQLRSRTDSERFVVLQSVEKHSQAVFLEKLRAALLSSHERHAFVFVHGYRVSFENAARRAAQLSVDLKIVPAVIYSWPSKERLLDYGADAQRARNSIPAFTQFLNLVADETEAEVIHLIAHSMGCLALTLALKDYISTRKTKTPWLREIVLAAPDIDVTEFKDQIVPRIRDKSQRTTLYASRRDYALLTSRWLRRGLSRAGFVEGDRPLVVQGVETVDISAVNSELAWGLLQGHSYVGERPEVVQDMYELLQFNKAAGKRFGNTQNVLDGIPYWVMQPRNR